MTKHLNHLKKHSTIDTSIQLVMPLNYEVLIPDDDSVRLLSQIVEEMDLSSLYQAYSLSGRNPAVPPRIMLKVMLYAYMEGIYSSRKIEKACKRDLNFKWLLEGYPVPDHNTISRFRRQRLTTCINELFTDFVMLLYEYDEIAFENVFIDGTKIEANANKYSFVWKKSTERNHERHISKCKAFFKKISDEFGMCLECDSDESIREMLNRIITFLCEKIEAENIDFVHGKGTRKTILQRLFEEAEGLLEKKMLYDTYFETFNGRNSFCKTDSDATFMHMKDDHMRNAQLKPGYNLQIAVEGGYVISTEAFPDANDLHTLKPFLEKIYDMYGIRIQNVVCDAGYESEENYAYLKACGQTPYIKPAMHDKWKKRSFKKDISRIENMEYDKDGDFYICSQGKKLELVSVRNVKRRRTDYESLQHIYECECCADCPVKSQCTKAKGNRILKVSKGFMDMRAESYANITSTRGIMLRMNRSIQAEGAFGAMKEDMDFRRFLMRGKENIMVEFHLLCLGFNINKFHNKAKNGLRGQLLYSKNAA